MQRPALIFENSPLFLILCVLAGVAYAYVLYQKKGPWGSTAKFVLFGLRAVGVALIAALLISPILRQIKNTVEEPTLVIALDNSESISEVVDSNALVDLKDRIAEVARGLEDDYHLEYRTLSGDKSDEMPSKLAYKVQTTDINDFLNDIKLDYEGRNLNGVVLVSDGIYNQGISPTFSDHNFGIYTIGVGDTIPKSDLSIVSLLYNKISYQGNKFPLIAQITHSNFQGQQATVSVLKNGKVIDSQRVTLGRDNQVMDIRFLIEASQSGYQRYQVKLEKKDNEFTYTNNIKQAYVEVIEGKEQIALIAYSPHPDIKAIKSAVESNQNYSIDQFILSLEEDVLKLNNIKKKYDLVIYHQLPDRANRSKLFIDKFEQANVSTLLMYGMQTDLRKFNRLNKMFSLDAVPNEYDEVTAAFNRGFTSFKLSDELQQSFEELPPLVVPFGRINMAEDAQVLLFQRVGKIETGKPLVAVKADGDVKRGVILADGLWKWKLTDYAKNDNNILFNELITKLVQYLSSKEDKRKFKVYPIKNEFLTNEKVVFDAEVYNDLYERVYGNKISIVLTDGEGSKNTYSYVTSENNTRYDISGLPEGVYKYTASTLLDGKVETVKGEFLIKELQLESINLTADFNLLRELANKSGGRFFKNNELEKLHQDLSTKKAQGIIRSNEKYLPFIHIKWLFFILLALLSAEWFIRKYSGTY